MDSEAIGALNKLVEDLKAAGWREQRRGWRDSSDTRMFKGPTRPEEVVVVSVNPPDVRTVDFWRAVAKQHGADI